MKKESDFLLWHNKKYNISNKDVIDLYFKEREIWFCHVGLNIGFEEDGKGKDFLRPVVIIKKFNRNMFIGLPLTTSLKHKNDKYYYKIIFNNVENMVILTQIKLYDKRRLKYKVGVIQNVDFLLIKEKLKDIIL